MKKMSALLKFEEAGAPPQTPILKYILKATDSELIFSNSCPAYWVHRVLCIATDQLKAIGTFCEQTASAFFDAIMETAIQCVGLSNNNLNLKPES